MKRAAPSTRFLLLPAVVLWMAGAAHGQANSGTAQIAAKAAAQQPTARKARTAPPVTAQAPAKPPMQATAKKPAAKPKPGAKAKGTKQAAKKPAEAAPKAAPAAAVAHRRDPFQALLAKKEGGVPEHLPPGKAGLVIATLRVDGVVKGPNGMIAAVTNPQQRVYFIREGDKLYDGSVEKIMLDEVSFRESSKDAFGRPIERTVVKRIYPSAGEQP